MMPRMALASSVLVVACALLSACASEERASDVPPVVAMHESAAPAPAVAPGHPSAPEPSPQASPAPPIRAADPEPPADTEPPGDPTPPTTPAPEPRPEPPRPRVERHASSRDPISTLAPEDVSDPTPVAPGPTPATPSRNAIQAAMQAAAPRVRACRASAGRVTVRVRLASTGRPESVELIGAGADVPEAACITRAIEAIRIPPFTQPTITFSYPLRLGP